MELVEANMKKLQEPQLISEDFEAIFDMLEDEDRSFKSKRHSSSQVTTQSTPPRKQKIANYKGKNNLSVIDEGSDESLRDSKVLSNVSFNHFNHKLTGNLCNISALSSTIKIEALLSGGACI